MAYYNNIGQALFEVFQIEMPEPELTEMDKNLLCSIMGKKGLYTQATSTEEISTAITNLKIAGYIVDKHLTESGQYKAEMLVTEYMEQLD